MSAVEIVKVTFEDCGFAFYLVDKDGYQLGAEFCSDFATPYAAICIGCGLRCKH